MLAMRSRRSDRESACADSVYRRCTIYDGVPAGTSSAWIVSASCPG